MNILIKLTCLIGLVIAPILGGHTESDSAMAMTSTSNVEARIEMTPGDSSKATAIVTTTTVENGISQTKEETFEGTLEEVEAKVKSLKDANTEVTQKTKKIIKEVEEEIKKN